MSHAKLASEPSAPVLELKAGTFPLLSLRLGSRDPDAIRAALAEKIVQAPRFFENAAVVLDLDALTEDLAPGDLLQVLDRLRSAGLNAIGAHGGDPQRRRQASEAGLALVGAAAPQRRNERPAPTARAVKVINRTIRSGQQVHAAGADLVVMGSVSAGAEVLADGHIHVMGALRGRALAGLDGDPQARILCQRLQAELVSIAGTYRLLEQIDPELNDVPAQVYLDGERLCIEAGPTAAG